MKTNFKKLIAFLLALAMLLTAFSGCNGKKSGSKKNKSKKKANTAVTSNLSSEGNTSSDLNDEDWEDPEDAGAEDDFDDPEEEEVIFSNIMLHNKTAVQQNFLGFNAIYHAYAYRKDQYGRTFTEKMAAEETARAARSGIHIARTSYDMDMAWDSKTQRFDFESEKMQGFYRFCLEMKKYNISVLVNHWYISQIAHWVYGHGQPDINGMPNVDSNGKTKCHPAIYVEGDQQATYDKFAEFMVDTVKALKMHGCSNANYISALTEPGINWDDDWGDIYKEGKQYAVKISNQTAEINNILNRHLRQAGLRSSVTIQGPNISGTAVEKHLTVPYMQNYLKKLEPGAVDLISAHRYHGKEMTDDNYELWDEWLNENESGFSLKNFIYDEYNCDPSDGNLVKNRNNAFNGIQIALGNVAMLNHGVQGSFLWSLFDQQWPDSQSTNTEFYDGVHLTGTAPTLLSSSIVYPSYYSFALTANLVGQLGSSVYAGDDKNTGGVYAAMTVGKDSSVNILVVNTNTDKAYLTLDFEKTIGGKTMYRHVYKAAEIVPSANTELLPPDLKITTVKQKLKDAVPPCSVVVYTTQQACK